MLANTLLTIDNHSYRLLPIYSFYRASPFAECLLPNQSESNEGSIALLTVKSPDDDLGIKSVCLPV